MPSKAHRPPRVYGGTALRVGFRSGLYIAERRRVDLLHERDGILAKYEAQIGEKERKISAGRPAGFPVAFAKFQKITGSVSLGRYRHSHY